MANRGACALGRKHFAAVPFPYRGEAAEATNGAVSLLRKQLCDELYHSLRRSWSRQNIVQLFINMAVGILAVVAGTRVEIFRG